LLEELKLLKELYGEVVIPEAVRDELLMGAGANSRTSWLAKSEWLRTMPVSDEGRPTLLSDLDRGEAEVIALALESNARLAIIDERLGRLHAKRLGLRVTGTLGVLLKSKERGLVDAVSPLIQNLRQEGFWLSEAVIGEALRLSGEQG